jgi:quercetin dioxygenase-like cupin family protein
VLACVRRSAVFFVAVICALAAEPKAEIENQWVRVWRITLAPHEKASLDSRLPVVAVALTGSVHYFDGKTKQAYENSSDRPEEDVLIELKDGAPRSPPVKLDPVKLDPAHHQVLLDNDRVRAIRTTLVPHLKSPMHEHPHYVVVYLTDLHTTMTLADGRKIDNPRKPGEIAWRDALSHVTENIGDRTAAEIQVEIR